MGEKILQKEENRKKEKIVLTYGTFDLLHFGHIRLLKRAKALGDYLIVALSTDEFNESKGKKSYYKYKLRKEMLEVIPEKNWGQKKNDVLKNDVDIVVMGGDWEGSTKFEYLKEYCDLVYLPRTPKISTTKIKSDLNVNKGKLEDKN